MAQMDEGRFALAKTEFDLVEVVTEAVRRLGHTPTCAKSSCGIKAKRSCDSLATATGSPR